MKKIISLCFLYTVAATACAQTETFDITTYTAPKGWKKQPSESAVQFIREDSIKNTYDILTLYKSVPSTANAKENFDMAWNSLVKETVTVGAAPEMLPGTTEDGWQIQSGYGAFENDGNKGVALLVTASGFDKMVNIVILTNTDVHEQTIVRFLESIVIKKPKQVSQPGGITNTSNAAIAGTWGFGSNAMMANNRYGPWNYSKQQYTFNPDGTYNFIRKTYRENDAETLLTSETGTYTISGKTLTIIPQKNVMEAWSKKNGGDNYNKLVSSQSQTIEKTSYSFYVYYDETIKQTTLMLQASTETKRDGRHNAEVESKKMWRYLQAPGYIVIKIPGE